MAGIDPFASITGAILDLLMRDGDLFLDAWARTCFAASRSS